MRMSPGAPFSISCPTKIEFGVGVLADLAKEIPRKAKQILLIRGAGGLAAGPVRDVLDQLDLNITECRAVGEPSVNTISVLREDVLPHKIDAVIACGGGAVIDTGKALAFCLAHKVILGDDFSEIDPDLLAQPSPIPLIVLPTTAGTGAEVTSNVVLDVPSLQAKISLRGRALFPHVAIIDPSLMVSAPPHVILQSGMDAVTQIIEAHTSVAATPFSSALTLDNLESGLVALRAAVQTPSVKTMSEMAWTALASGLALANGGLGAAHGLASVVGGRFAAPHGALCGRLLTPVLRHNLARAELGSDEHVNLDRCCAAIESVFTSPPGTDDLCGLEAWLATHNLPYLADFGVRADDFDGLAEQAMAASSSRKNAVVLEKADYVGIMADALVAGDTV